jgi:hypothetical protein
MFLFLCEVRRNTNCLHHRKCEFLKVLPIWSKNLEETLPLIVPPIRKYTVLMLCTYVRTSVFYWCFGKQSHLFESNEIHNWNVVLKQQVLIRLERSACVAATHSMEENSLVPHRSAASQEIPPSTPFAGTWRFIVVFTRARPLSQSWARLIQTTPSNPPRSLRAVCYSPICA